MNRPTSSTAPLLRQTSLVFALLVAASSWLASPPATAGEQTLNGQTFTLPDGFVIEPIAGPPLVDRPIVADFDAQGRLYVADSSGSNDPVKKQLEEKPHRIVRLEDTDGDGRFDRQTVFADHMMFPEGVMYHAGSVYVAAPPSIWKLTDTNDDGVADERVEWFSGKTLTGCANDLHGPYLGPDGWIYWCKGAFAEQTYERPGKPPFVTKASHIFRARVDGSGIEPVMTGGMDNPVDTVFTPGGERIFSCTFLQHPAGGRRDGLIHAIYGGVYGKVHNVLDNHVWTGPEVMPVLVHLGPAAACGLTTYESIGFGPEYRDNLFACSFNLRKITRHVLTPEGGSFATRDEDFLVSNFQDFHPTDVLDDADGSLVVVDTGGWYKLCCPTSQLQKPDVLGSIYRIRKTGAPKVDDPRGLKLAWDKVPAKDLVARLDDPRPAVRKRAIETLARDGAGSVETLAQIVRNGASAEARRNAVWTLTRIDGDAARAAVRAALADFDETVRQAAIHSASVRLDRGALQPLIMMLSSPSAHNRRAAAEAVGRLGDRAAVPALVSAAGKAADRALEHATTYALIEIADREGTTLNLMSANPRSRRAALVALDQMSGGGLTPELVAPDLASADGPTRETAAWIVGRHPEWGGALADFFRQRLHQEKLSETDLAELPGQLARFAATPAIQEVLVEPLRSPASAAKPARLALQAMALASLKAAPAAWVEALATIVGSSDADLRKLAIAAARALPIPASGAERLRAALLAVGQDAAAPVAQRLDALAAMPGGLSPTPDALLAFLIEQLNPDAAVATRSAAANVVAKAKLANEQLIALATAAKTVSPLEMDRVLTAYEQSKDAAVGHKLLAALRECSSVASLRVDMLRPRIDKYPQPVRDEADDLYARLNVNAAEQKARLEAILPAVAQGDIRRGQAVFNSQKAACISCHAMGYVGGKVGPDLTRIGTIRNERDLLESILYPSLSFVRSFEPLTVATREGKVVNGLVKKDSADEMILQVNATEEARIPRDAIEEIRAGTVSVMPAGLDQQLSPQELADLVAFLKSRK